MRPAAPVAHGDADDGLRAFRARLRQNHAPAFFVDGMNGEHGVRSLLDARLRHAKARELLERAVVAHRDEAHAVQNFPRDPAREAALDRADTLRVEHNGRMHGKREEDDTEVVVEAPAARDVLQQAAAARDQEIGMAEELQDG